MLRFARNPLVLFVSTPLLACASDGSDGNETSLSGGAASQSSSGPTASGEPSSSGPIATAPSGTPSPSVGPAMSNETPANGGNPGLEDLPGSESPENEEPMPSPVTTDGEELPSTGDETDRDDDNSSEDEGTDGMSTDDQGPASGGSPGLEDTPGAGGEAAGAGGAPGEEEPVTFTTCPDDTWRVVWSDEFDGPAGSAVDGSKWTYDSGPNWYNGELQYYSTGTDNASLDGNGNLVIEARREDREGRQYTSARLKTEGKHAFTYGRMEGRMKLPYGQGMWPAFWMLGGNTWPGDGEIDVMENLGREPSIIHGTIHGPGYSGADGPGTAFTLPDGEVFSDDFHIFAVEWEPNAIRWYMDGEHYSTKTPSDIGGNRWVFDHPFFFLVNLAVGGEWPGNPDQTTVFPQRFLIDYIRVCEK